MYILSASQIRRADAFTILEEPVKSIDLMERAAEKCFEWFKKHVDKHNFIQIFCGPGNNGGDGLALARMLYGSGYEVKATLLQFDLALSMDCKLNLERLQKIDQGMVNVVKDNFEFPQLPKTTFLVDAIFGTGLSRNIDGEIGTVITAMNSSSYPIISIDLPSGINSDNTSLNNDNKIVISNTTLTFQYPKLALLVSENAQFYGQVEVLDIGLSPNAIPESEVINFQVDREMLVSIYVPKREFSHKGNFGHGLLITGEKGKMGAAVLASGGFLRSGGGLLTLLVPDEGIPIVQSAVPEAMVAIIKNEELLPVDCNKFSAIGVGPGLGQDPKAVKRLKQLIDSYHKPIVFDADALNILSSHPDWLQQLPQGSY
ncbi:MAG: NAD(P)H-hydrate epimerase [Bacteroidetes bacterium]|nr:NAD(P)H-hydrate epimerase [Bacteroidota bacterium]